MPPLSSHACTRFWVMLLSASLAGIAVGADKRPPCPPCPPAYCPPWVRSNITDLPSDQDPNAPVQVPNAQPMPQPAANPFQAQTASSSPFAGTPNMIGDLFGSVNGSVIPSAFDALVLDSSTTAPIAGGGSVGRQKIAEQTNPLPQDRVFFNYSHYKGVPLVAGGQNVNRYTFGLEKTFLDGLASAEVRIPFANTIGSTFDTDPTVSNGSAAEFGDITLTGKAVLKQTSNSVISTGLSMSLPTADDQVFTTSGFEYGRVSHESVHLMPFVATVYREGDWFTMAYFQVDFDANGDTISNNTSQLGTFREQTVAMLDVAVGKYLTDNIAAIVELHYNREISNPDVVRNALGAVAAQGGQVDVLNAIVGTSLQMTDSTNVTLGYSLPVGNKADQQFDGEFRLMVNILGGAHH